MTDPTPSQVARALREAATALDKHGMNALRSAPLLASRGYPTSTLGDGGSRGNSELTSTERAAATRDEWTGIDDKLTRWLTTTYQLACSGTDLLSKIVAHADPTTTDRKNRHPGAGPCNACGRDVPGTATDRLRSGWCSACLRAWEREDRPDRMLFERRRYADKNPPVTMTVDPTDPLAVPLST